MVHIDWISPQANEPLDQYAKRLYDDVRPEDNYNLVGVSFGGMIAAEFAKIKKKKNLLLISTIYNKSELPNLYKFGAAIRLHRLLPTGLMRRSNFLTYSLFGVKRKDDKKLLKQILLDTNPVFLRWAINAMTKWTNNAVRSGIKIHGNKDKILPLKSKADFIIEGGGHFMIVTKGAEISKIIDNEVHNTR